MWRVVDQGNVVQFGPKAANNYVWKPTTNEKTVIRRKRRSFVLDIDMVKPKGEEHHLLGQA